MGEGGVRRAWDVVRVVERNTNMGCSRSRRGGRKTRMGFDRNGRLEAQHEYGM